MSTDVDDQTGSPLLAACAQPTGTNWVSNFCHVCSWQGVVPLSNNQSVTFLVHSVVAMQAADDAADARWYDVRALPKLAFDHKLVVRECFKHASKMQAALSNDMATALEHASETLAGDWRKKAPTVAEEEHNQTKPT
jgi:hypothetical protein